MHSDRSHHSVGLPHSEIRGSQPSYRLLSAFRRFSRPSSPLNAKASIMCPFSLGHAYLTPCGAGHATSGLCGSGQSRARRTTHARRRLDTRDRSRCSIQSCASGRSWLREIPGLHACPVAHDQHFTCQRKPTRSWRMGIGNGSESVHAVKGVEGGPALFFIRSRYQQRPPSLSS